MLPTIQITLPVFTSRARDAAAIAAEAEGLEKAYGEDAIARIRDKIAVAERADRARLYRVHDQIARRRTGDGA